LVCRSLLVAAPLACVATLAGAADLGAADPAPLVKAIPAPVADWTVTLGLDGRVLPHFMGSNSYLATPVPIIDVRRAGTEAPFRAPRDGFGFAILDTGQFKVGPVFQVELGRAAHHNNPEWAGLPRVPMALEAGVFVDYWATKWLRAHVEVRQGMGGHDGVVADQALDIVMPVARQWTLSGGPRLTEATAEANRPYFGIDAATSLASNLPVYDPGGGLRSAGAGTQARYQWNPQWETHAYYEYQRLVDGVAQAPLVIQRGSPNQNMYGLGATYSFDVKSPW
jgi:outer membrane protein